ISAQSSTESIPPKDHQVGQHCGTLSGLLFRNRRQLYVVDTSRPIVGTSSHRDDGAADAAARRVSRNGGTARITLCDSITGDETEIRTYTPYEVALQDLVDSEPR
ncbi:hypothetical protein, partial [Mycobacterium avium]|uniref:hypothetical protein n=5 Tax=Mycobacterium avium TaxID=1764 RepID=UPI0021E6C25B